MTRRWWWHAWVSAADRGANRVEARQSHKREGIGNGAHLKAVWGERSWALAWSIGILETAKAWDPLPATRLGHRREVWKGFPCRPERRLGLWCWAEGRPGTGASGPCSPVGGVSSPEFYHTGSSQMTSRLPRRRSPPPAAETSRAHSHAPAGRGRWFCAGHRTSIRWGACADIPAAACPGHPACPGIPAGPGSPASPGTPAQCHASRLHDRPASWCFAWTETGTEAETEAETGDPGLWEGSGALETLGACEPRAAWVGRPVGTAPAWTLAGSGRWMTSGMLWSLWGPGARRQASKSQDHLVSLSPSPTGVKEKDQCSFLCSISTP